MSAHAQAIQEMININRLANLTAIDLNELERKSVLTLAYQLLEMKSIKRMEFVSPNQIREYLRMKYGYTEHEVFSVIYLDTRHRLIKHEELFRGTIDGASVYTREVVKESLTCNAAAVVFAHNHPSGDATPSQADIRITMRLKDALALVDIRVLDHLVVGKDEIVSLAERGTL